MLFKTAKFFLYATVFNVAIVSTGTLFPFIVGKYMWVRMSVDLALIFFLLGLVFDERADFVVQRVKDLWKRPLVWAVTAFVLMFILAGFFGVNPPNSFWSNFERGEGGFQILHLYLFFALLVVLFKEEKDWQKLFIFSIIAAVLMVAYGVGAGLKYVGATTDSNGNLTGGGGQLFQTFKGFVGPSFSEPGFRFQGSIGNSAYVAAYLIFAVFYSLLILLSKYRSRFKSPGALFVIAGIILFGIFFYLAATRGAFLGLVAAILAGVAYLAFNKAKYRKILIPLGIVVIAIVLTMIQFRNNQVVKNLPGSRIFDISFSATTFQHRTLMWKIAWDGFKERPIFGYGPENFLKVFDTHFNTAYLKPPEPFGAWFDRAHSVVFDYLAETGILGFLSYISMFVLFYLEFFSMRRRIAKSNGNENKNDKSFTIFDSEIIRAVLFALPVGYLVQGIILFDVLTIYFNLFIFLAFAVFYFNSSEAKMFKKS